MRTANRCGEEGGLRMKKRDLVAALGSSVCIVAMAVPAQAQSQAFNIPRGKLKNAIDAYVRQTGRPVIYKADEIANAHSRGVRGTISHDRALANLLQRSGRLEARRVGKEGVSKCRNRWWAE